MASATWRCKARRSDWRYSSSQPRLSQRRPSYIEVSEASVLRSTSVSSMRRIMAPPLRGAYNELKMNVRALPMCKKPVGEGAKRTLSMGNASITRCGKGLGDVCARPSPPLPAVSLSLPPGEDRAGHRLTWPGSNFSLRHCPHEAAELDLLFQPARPDQFIVPHRDIGAAVAHAHGPVAENVRGLDDGDRLKMQSSEQVERVLSDGTEILLGDPSQAWIERCEEEHGFPLPLNTGLCVGQVCALPEMVDRLGQLHELGAHIPVYGLLRSDAPRQQPLEGVGFLGAVQVGTGFEIRISRANRLHHVVGEDIQPLVLLRSRIDNWAHIYLVSARVIVKPRLQDGRPDGDEDDDVHDIDVLLSPRQNVRDVLQRIRIHGRVEGA